MSDAPARKDFAAIKQMKAVMGKYFRELAGAPKPDERRPGAPAWDLPSCCEPWASTSTFRKTTGPCWAPPGWPPT